MSYEILDRSSQVHGWIPKTALAMNCRRIFIAVSDPFTRRFLSYWFEKQGHEVVAAMGGNLLLDFVENLPRPSQDNGDLLITDEELPDMEGTELRTRLTAKGWPLATLYLLEDPAFEPVLRSTLDPMQKTITKPISLGELDEAVRSLSH